MKKIILLLFIALFFTNSCRNEATLNDDKETVVPEFKYNYGNEVSRNFFGQVLDRSGNPVPGVTISIGTATIQTTSKGYFILKNVSVKENFAHVKATKPGFVNAARVLLPTTGDNRINIMMIPANTTATVNSGTTSSVSLPDGSKVKFDGSFKNENGTAYSGSVNVALFNLKTSDPYFSETLPGSLLASDTQGNSTLMESYGMMHVQLTSSSGQKLQIADGHTAELTSPIDASQISTSPATIPLWSYNEDTGIWKEEGSASKVGNKYVGNVSHFSWWNCDVPQQYASLQLTITNTANLPIFGVRVGLSVATQPYEVSGTTNNLGIVSGLVPANQNIMANFYDYCNNVIYSTSLGSFTGLSNNIAITISTATAPSTTITGTLLDCSGNNVTNGIAQLFTSTSNYFSNVMYAVTNGQFTFVTLVCSSSQQFEVVGYDYNNLQSTGSINFTASVPTTNLGFITTCNALDEFITYQIDSQTPITCFGNFSAGSTAGGNLGFTSSISHYGPFVFNFSYPYALLTAGLTLNSNYNLQFSGNNAVPAGGINNINMNGTTNNIVFKINSIGNVGDYLDFTFNGNYTDSLSVVRTINGTGHVFRDY